MGLNACADVSHAWGKASLLPLLSSTVYLAASTKMVFKVPRHKQPPSEEINSQFQTCMAQSYPQPAPGERSHLSLWLSSYENSSIEDARHDVLITPKCGESRKEEGNRLKREVCNSTSLFISFSTPVMVTVNLHESINNFLFLYFLRWGGHVCHNQPRCCYNTWGFSRRDEF